MNDCEIAAAIESARQHCLAVVDRMAAEDLKLKPKRFVEIERPFYPWGYVIAWLIGVVIATFSVLSLL